MGEKLGGNIHDYLMSVISTPDGGYLLGGDSQSRASGDKSENNKGDYDYWIVKTDMRGSKMWDRTFGGDDNDELNKIIPTSDGGYLLVGQSKSSISEDKNENPKGGCEVSCYYDFWVLKIDAQGNKVWDKTLLEMQFLPRTEGIYCWEILTLLHQETKVKTIMVKATLGSSRLMTRVIKSGIKP